MNCSTRIPFLASLALLTSQVKTVIWKWWVQMQVFLIALPLFQSNSAGSPPSSKCDLMLKEELSIHWPNIDHLVWFNKLP